MAEIYYTPLKDAADIQDMSAASSWAAKALRTNLARIQDKIPALASASIDKLAPISASLYVPPEGAPLRQRFKVGIIGAGISGLFTALIFDHLKEKFNLDVEYEILEANGEDRLGGRLYTHYFKNVQNPTKYDYYDVGAMRFPEIPTMDRTFELFEFLKMEKKSTPKDAEPGDLVPYYLDGPGSCSLYNGIRVVGPITPYHFKIPDLPQHIEKADPGDVIADAIEPYTTRYKDKGAKRFWDYLLRWGDKHTVRSYLAQEAMCDYNTIEMLETLSWGNRWFDQAFSEMVLDSLNFDSTAKWRCVFGGAQQIAFRTAKALKLQDSIKFNSPVKAIAYEDKDGNIDTPENIDASSRVDVTLKDGTVKKYDAVFNSVSLAAMQHMELEGLDLHWGVKQAIRSLGYGASCKVGIRFKEMWWMKAPYNIKKGGSSKTDLPIRCCVYPSYNVECDPDKGGVLLVSYTWSQEAERIGALIDRKSPDGEEELKKLIFHDLARLHTDRKGQDDDFKKLYAQLEDLYEDHYAYNWYTDPTQCGAFAYFGPSQFQKLYPFVTRSNGKHIIIGEATSPHHAWVVGSLDSAVRGVYQFLYRHSLVDAAADEALQAYNKNQIDGPFGPLPAEWDRTDDCQFLEKNELLQPGPDSAEKADYSLRGDFARQQVLFEALRLQQGGDTLNPSILKVEALNPLMKAINEVMQSEGSAAVAA